MRAGTYQSIVERGMQRSFATLALLLAVLWVVTLVSSAGRLNGWTALVGWFFVGVLAAGAFRAWRCLLGPADVWAACVAAALVYSAIAVSGPDVFVLGARGAPALVAAILAAGFLLPARAWVVCAAVCLGQVAVSMPQEGLPRAVESLWPTVSGAIAAGVVTRVMRAAAGKADHAQEELLAVQAVEAQAEGRRAAHRMIRRTLHDDVAAALRAVAGPGVTWPEVQKACAAALTAISRAPAPSSAGVVDLAEEVGKLDGVVPVATTVHGDRHVPVPRAVAAAMLAAAREALRNVHRHARAATVRLLLEEDAHGVTLVVSDDGVGFSPSQVGPSSWGLRGSVVEPMAEVGGTAEVVSTPGEGTSVRLRWGRDGSPAPVVRRPERARLITLAVGDVRKPLAAVCVPYLLSMYVVAMVHGEATEGWGTLIAWYSGVVVMTLVLIGRAHRPVPRWTGCACAAFALVGLVYGLLVIPADSLDDFGSWPIGAVSPLLVVLLAVRSMRSAVVPLLIEEAAVLSLIVSGELDAGSLGLVLPALLAPVFGVVMAGMIVETVVRLAVVVSDAYREQVAVTAAEATRQAQVRLRQRRLAEIGTELLPFLRQIATAGPPSAGALPEDALPEGGSPDHGRLRARARELESMARDELHLPGVIDADIRMRLRLARRAGCLVTFQSDTDSVDPPLVLRRLLANALTGPVPPKQLTLSLYPGAEGVTVSLVTVPGDADRGARLRRSLVEFSPVVDEQPEATSVHLTVRWDGR